MKKIFHCADIHLGAQSRFIPDLLESQFRVLDGISNDAMKEGACSVVIAGDLFDSPHVPSAVIERLSALVGKYPSLPYVVVSGTHGHDSFDNEKSIYRRSSFRSFPGNFHHLDLDRGYAVIDGVAYYSASCGLSALPAADHHVLLFHGTYEDAVSAVSSSALKRCDYIAMGHFHCHREYAVNRSRASHSGTLLAFEWPKGNSGANESTYSEAVFDAGSVTVSKRYSSDVKFMRAFVPGAEQLRQIESSITGNTWLALYGRPQFREEAERMFRDRVNQFSYRELQIKDMPELLVRSVEEIIAGQDDESIPWNDVKEAALRLLSGEEGKDFLNPLKYLGTL